MGDRPHLPNPLRREVLVEAGHRCAIPTCRLHPVEVAHIEPRRPDGSNDVFDNLIALCPNCHTRYDNGEMDRPSMRQYKANPSVLNARYGDVEKRVLQFFADNPHANAIQLPGGLGVLLEYLLKDGYVRQFQPTNVGRVEIMGVPSQEYFAITEAGRDFISRWLEARDLEQS